MRAAIILAAILSAMTGPAVAGEPTERDRFNLWTGCKPIGLEALVEDDDDKSGLTDKAVETAGRSRLRAARLYTSDLALGALLVYVHVVEGAFHVEVEFFKPLHDEMTGLRRQAITWEGAATGIHGGDPTYIVGFVGQTVDSFIDEYLRVNETACAKR